MADSHKEEPSAIKMQMKIEKRTCIVSLIVKASSFHEIKIPPEAPTGEIVGIFLGLSF